MIKFTLGDKGSNLKRPTCRTLLEHDNIDKENKTMSPIDGSLVIYNNKKITQGKRFFLFWKYKE